MTIARLASLLFLCAASIPAFSQSEPRALQAEDKIARPVFLVSPTFPAREPADKLPVEIQIKGKISATGALESPVFSPTAGSEKFIRTIEKVIALWRFRPAVDEGSCLPISSDGVVTVWFEEKNGSPSVSVSTPAARKVAADDSKPRAESRKFVWRPKVVFPSDAKRTGMEGVAELLFKVNPQGDVLHAEVLYSTPSKVFGDTAMEGTKFVTFSPVDAAADPRQAACIVLPFNFCLSEAAPYPNSACNSLNRFAKQW